ncbi:hypothetical protein EVAR_24117_1 [Eumeta japonica]|uniref:Uncharacterized protein n=1 Tax=Eumeta variegata TaxID=151549 RepID=A0A4C1YQH2_EUMVA|nr:hypothetical protein EVAR_24117_1 [Eumeta japonica]
MDLAEIAHEAYDSRTPAIQMAMTVLSASETVTEISSRNKIKKIFQGTPRSICDATSLRKANGSSSRDATGSTMIRDVLSGMRRRDRS